MKITEQSDKTKRKLFKNVKKKVTTQTRDEKKLEFAITNEREITFCISNNT